MESRSNTKAAAGIEMSRTPYEEMIKMAITTLKERSGSTMASILKLIQVKWPRTEPKVIRSVARRMVKLGELIKVRSSYKLSKKEISKELKEAKKPRKSHRKCASASKPGRKPAGGRRKKVAKQPKKRSLLPKEPVEVKTEQEVIVIKDEPNVEKPGRKPRKAKAEKNPRKPRVYKKRSRGLAKRKYVRKAGKLPKEKIVKRGMSKKESKARKMTRVPKAKKAIKKLLTK